MGKSQKATCESKALEGLFPPHGVHKLVTVQFLRPLQGLHPHGWLPPGWTAKIRATFWSWKREEDEGHRQTQLALTPHTPIPMGRSCNGILHLSSHQSHGQTTGTCSECLPQPGSRRDGAGLEAQRALAVAFGAGGFFGCPQRDCPRVKKGKCYIARGHGRVLKQRNDTYQSDLWIQILRAMFTFGLRQHWKGRGLWGTTFFSYSFEDLYSICRNGWCTTAIGCFLLAPSLHPAFWGRGIGFCCPRQVLPCTGGSWVGGSLLCYLGKPYNGC